MFGFKRSTRRTRDDETHPVPARRPRGRTRRELLAAGAFSGAAVLGFGFSGSSGFPDVTRAAPEGDPEATAGRAAGT